LYQLDLVAAVRSRTLWPLVSNTTFRPRLRYVALGHDPFTGDDALTNARARITMAVYGVSIEYVQEPFEWTIRTVSA